jgi:hypothetical protein
MKQRLLVMNGQCTMQQEDQGQWRNVKVEKARGVKPGIYNRVYAQLVLVNAGGLPPLGLFVDESTNCLYDGSIN